MIANMCCDAMRKMGYVRTYGPQPITNAADTSLYRMVARFNRIVTSVGEIEKILKQGELKASYYFAPDTDRGIR